MEAEKPETNVVAQYGANKVIDVYMITGDGFSFCTSNGGAYANVEMETGSSNEYFVHNQRDRDVISNTIIQYHQVRYQVFISHYPNESTEG